MTTAEISAVLGVILFSLGVTVPPSDFAGGMFLAVASAFLLMAWSEPGDRKSYVLTLVTSVMFGSIAAMMHGFLFPTLLLQVKMAAAGALSKWIAEGLISFGKGMKEQFGKLPEAISNKFLGGNKAPAQTPPPVEPSGDMPFEGE